MLEFIILQVGGKIDPDSPIGRSITVNMLNPKGSRVFTLLELVSVWGVHWGELSSDKNLDCDAVYDHLIEKLLKKGGELNGTNSCLNSITEQVKPNASVVSHTI